MNNSKISYPDMDLEVENYNGYVKKRRNDIFDKENDTFL